MDELRGRGDGRRGVLNLRPPPRGWGCRWAGMHVGCRAARQDGARGGLTQCWCEGNQLARGLLIKFDQIEGREKPE